MLAETGLLGLFRLLVLKLDHLVSLELVPDGEAGGSVEGRRGRGLRERAIELGEHAAVLHDDVFEFVAGVVVELVGGRDTILVKSMYLIPLSSLSLKKLNSWLIFSSYGAFVMRADSPMPYIGPPGTPPCPPVAGPTRRIAGRAWLPRGRSARRRAGSFRR